MKLRLQSNSIRLRLKQSEVALFSKTGRVEEEIVAGPGETFRYVLETSSSIQIPEAKITGGSICVQVPGEAVTRWVSTNDVAIEGKQPAGEGRELLILIEKDFACLDGNPEQNFDTFPNPLAGTKC